MRSISKIGVGGLVLSFACTAGVVVTRDGAVGVALAVSGGIMLVLLGIARGLYELLSRSTPTGGAGESGLKLVLLLVVCVLLPVLVYFAVNWDYPTSRIYFDIVAQQRSTVTELRSILRDLNDAKSPPDSKASHATLSKCWFGLLGEHYALDLASKTLDSRQKKLVAANAKTITAIASNVVASVQAIAPGRVVTPGADPQGTGSVPPSGGVGGEDGCVALDKPLAVEENDWSDIHMNCGTVKQAVQCLNKEADDLCRRKDSP